MSLRSTIAIQAVHTARSVVDITSKRKMSLNCLKIKKWKRKAGKQQEETPLARIWRLEYLNAETPGVDLTLESEYYISKGLRTDDPKSALEGFRRVLELQTELGEWGFRALKQIIKIYSKFDEYKKMQETFSQMLPYVESILTPNYGEKSIGNLLEYLKAAGQHDIAEVFCEIILHSFSAAPHEKLWLRVKRFLVDLRVENGQFPEAQEIIWEMRQFCEFLDPSSGCYKEKELMKICDREMEICTMQKDEEKVNQLTEEYSRLKCKITV